MLLMERFGHGLLGGKDWLIFRKGCCNCRRGRLVVIDSVLEASRRLFDDRGCLRVPLILRDRFAGQENRRIACGRSRGLAWCGFRWALKAGLLRAFSSP